MARANQKAESLEKFPHRCPCGRVAKFTVHRNLACTLHVANAIRNVMLANEDLTVPVEVFGIEGQL